MAEGQRQWLLRIVDWAFSAIVGALVLGALTWSISLIKVYPWAAGAISFGAVMLGGWDLCCGALRGANRGLFIFRLA
jgi:hypothetical protein